ncbi:pentapeptide repeat-containing protein [Photobacterium sp. WH24]|uniref:Pentapeptide repeat-containing protein n=1 Tax=Photobacterium arenosum TaxID=2774143 RepID=A0ABR9BPY2_9GAMM|nr:pentapeptide repeat-containing protein [Photobacterium arenosum]MBD8514621.1 pentapeptide repeat-containing protein [Photobacterium arenosum]MBV7262603.1 pentapeptide repeat-containing protein [Photobacterium sp. WH24]
MKHIDNDEQYYNQTFDKLSLSLYEFADVEFEDCEFNDCNFTEAVFKNCKFINCQFHQCNLSLLKIPHTRFFDVSFLECKLVGIDWTQANWPSFNIDHELRFRKCILNDASFFGLTLNELRLDDCKLHDVDFREGDYKDSVMTFCDFTHSLFMRSDLRRVDFTESTHYNIHVLDNQVEGAKFSRFEALHLLESLGIELVD